MYSQTFQIGGYQPTLQAEQSGRAAQGQLAIQDGQNFAWHTRGVFSAHSYEQLTAVGPANDLHPSDFTISNKQVFCFKNGIYELTNGAYVALYNFNLPQTPGAYDLTAYKWSYAYVGTTHYFSHPTVSHLIWYDEFLDTWGAYRDDCWSGPLYGITHSDNRLVLQLTDVVGWSKFDDGKEWGTNWYKGIGYQSIALVRYGQPFGVQPYRNGWLSFTSHGIMVSRPEYSGMPDPASGEGGGQAGGQAAFNHEELNFDDLPLGPCAHVHVEENQVIWVSRKGFHEFAASSGSNAWGELKDWQAGMGLFYRESIIPQRVDEDTRSLDDFCLNYTREIGWLFVSSRSQAASVTYDRAHVYQFEIEKWGSFDHEHTHVGFGHNENDRVSDFYGFLDETGRYCKVDHVPRNFNSWVKFTPQRLEAPQEPTLSADIQISAQGIRLGVSKPVWSQTYKAGRTSSWFNDKQSHEHPTKCDVLVSAGNDANTYVVDEQEYAHLIQRNDEVITYACHATGGAHTVFLIAEDDGYYFDVSHIEIDFFFAGIK